jgi:replicative DNA helicase
VPPSDLEAEKSILGSMLADDTCIDDVALAVQGQHFYSFANQLVFAAIVAMHGAGKGVDAVTLGHKLQSMGQLEEIGGPVYLVELMRTVPHAAHWKHYCQIVRDLAYRREVIQQATGLIQAAHNNTADQDAVLQAVEAQVTQLVESRTRGSGAVDLMTCLLEAMDRIGAGGTLGVQTGFTDLDDITTGLHPGQLVVVAARPSVGKTAFALNLAHAMSKHTPVLFVSLEMSRLELAERVVSLDSGVPLQEMRQGDLSAEQHEQLQIAANALHNETKLYIDDSSDLTPMRLSGVARLMRRKNKIGLLVVDYLQLIEPTDRRMQREQQVADMSRSLKCLAKSLQIPVIVLAQLNRDIEKRTDKRPLLSDLRESGAIEQDADQVWMLHREEVFMDETDPEIENVRGKAEVFVRKNRSGRTGQCTLTFLKESMRFRNYSGGHSPRLRSGAF